MFAVDLAQLAREVAMDIFPLKDILELHRLSDADWLQIVANPTFQKMLTTMSEDWNVARSTPDRIKAKAQTAVEALMETYVRAVTDETIPLIQRVEAGKFLARLGELDGKGIGATGGEKFSIVLNIGAVQKSVDVQLPADVSRIIDATAIPDE